MDLLGAAANVRDRAVTGHLADLRRMPRELIDEAPAATLHRYLPLDGQASQPDPDLAPVLVVPPLGAPDFAYDPRRGSIPAPMVKWAFQLSTVDKYLTKPLTVLSRLDDRDVLEQIEAVDYLMSHMHGYPGRTFGQIYHLMMRANDLGDGGLDLADRRIELAEVRVPVLVVAGENDVIAPLRAVRRGAELLTGSPEVRFETAPGGHLGVLTGRRARDTTWAYLDEFLGKHDVV
jgi:polyhydroxyalkanoate synthase